MNLERRIEAFVELGNRIKFISPDDYRNWVSAARNANNWFTERSIELALEGVTKLLDEKNLKEWLEKYEIRTSIPKKVGVVMAGNIPMVGFHDFLSVLVSGHQLFAKLSSQDNVLIKRISDYLIDIENGFRERIHFTERLTGMDAVIATGSDNTAKYFNYYFSSVPHIIRQNRVSCAVLTGEESDKDLQELGKDIFLYFGMGCRNVAKMYVPAHYDFSLLLKSLDKYKDLVDLHKYYNNYDYNKSVYLLNKTPHLDNGFCIFTESDSMVSPVSVVYYETYHNREDLDARVARNKDKIQVMVSKDGHFPGSKAFGEAQFPLPSDYADGVDTIRFLDSLQ